MRERLGGIFIACLAAGAGVGLALAGLWCAGYPPGAVTSVWLSGVLGSRAGWAQSLQEAGPLLMTGLATAVAFRAGALSIGVEGQFLLGGIGLVGCGTQLASWPPAAAMAAGLLVAVLAGAGWAGIAGLLERWRGVPLVLSTILLNFVAAALVSWLIQVPLHDPTTDAPQTAELPEGLHLPILLAGTQLHLGVAIAFALALAAWVVQARTVVGFEVSVVGTNPQVARLCGMPVAGLRMGALLASGAIAALGGALQQAGVTYFMSNSSVSYGYAGIAVALLGRLHPAGVAAAAVFFGMLDTGARALELSPLAIPHDVGDLLKGVVLLMVLIGSALLARLQARARQP